MDFFLSTSPFRFVTNDPFRSEFQGQVKQIPDDFQLPAYQMIPSYEYSQVGACRNTFHSTYTILMKYRLDPGRYSLNFLTIANHNGTTQLSVTLNLCSSMVELSFGPDCPIEKIEMPYESSNSGVRQWEKMAIVIGENYIALYINCQIKYILRQDVSQCQIQCSHESTVSIIQPANRETCGQGNSPRTVSSTHILPN